MDDYTSEMNDILSNDSYDSKYNVYSSMIDEDEEIIIKGRDVTLNNIGTIVKGDSNSQMLSFKINRYYEGVDLSTKNINFIYYLFGDSIIKSENAINVKIEDEYIKFCWLLSSNVTISEGTINAIIQFSGSDELSKPYILKTKIFQFKIENSI